MSAINEYDNKERCERVYQELIDTIWSARKPREPFQYEAIEGICRALAEIACYGPDDVSKWVEIALRANLAAMKVIGPGGM